MSGFKFKARNHDTGESGDKVKRAPGASYTFPGEVVGAFRNKAGRPLYNVEHDTEPGLIHLFREADLEKREEPTS